MIEKHGDHFLRHVFTEHEILYSSTKKRSVEHFAGRWAAKEAMLKAIGTGWISGITWKDVEIRNDGRGKPSIELSGGAKKFADKLGITEIHLSISHCTTHAIAQVVAVSD